jgi:hypothetical protein
MIITDGQRSISDQKGLPTLSERKPVTLEMWLVWSPAREPFCGPDLLANPAQRISGASPA